MNQQIDFNNLQPVTNVNTRVNYDLRYSAKTGRFNLSQSAFDKFDIANHGFNVMRQGNTIVLELVPNSEAQLHGGRKDTNKGLSFTAKSIVNILGLNADTNFTFDVHTMGDSTFLVLTEDSQPGLLIVVDDGQEYNEGSVDEEDYAATINDDNYETF